MAPEYKLIIRSPAGVKQAELSDMAQLAYSDVVNAPGVCTFRVRGNSPVMQYLIDKAQVEVWWRDGTAGIAWFQDFDGLVRDEESTAPDGVDLLTITAPGSLCQLGWRHNLYAAGTANKTAWTSAPAETIMKNLVTNNHTSAATVANGRDREGAFADRTITVQTNAGLGTTLNWTNTRENVLSDLQALAAVAGGDFDLIKTGVATWDFRFYAGQRGTDRSATVLFALERGNMAKPVLRRTRSSEATVAIVGGDGEGAARAIAVRTGPNYRTDNNIEIFTDARGATVAALNAKGDAALQEKREMLSFSFEPLQTPSTLYGKHYFVGDLVSARYRGVTMVLQVVSADIALEDDGGRSVKIGMRVHA